MGMQTSKTKANILIVDDAPTNLRLLSQMLMVEGYEVCTLTSGKQALSYVRESLPDLILLDIMMPGMTGYEVCEVLKTDPHVQDIPIIFISALNDVQDKLQAFSVGGVDYIAKPFEFKEVIVRVETHLALRNLQHQLLAANQELEKRLSQLANVNQQLEHTNIELQSRNAELDAFAHTVAHDIKNPLSAILSFSYILENRQDRLTPEKITDYAKMISQNGRKMRTIVDELLLLASVRRMEDVQMRPLDMDSIVKESLERLTSMLQKYEFQLILPDNWPTALGYAPWIEEVWANYISNAIKHGVGGNSETGHNVPLSVELGATVQSMNEIRYWVRDNGPGIAVEDQERIFAPFTRLRYAHAEGHGLGLSIVQRIISKLGGQVGVDSEVGLGSCFWFTLPVFPKDH
ncbi:MAG: hybrid sensor histidine kinase/response regulator [Anaerolineae bacterium]|nr:hybrid sensor histidine kinase/response regulator [Anaerolineae bacterium]